MDQEDVEFEIDQLKKRVDETLLEFEIDQLKKRVEELEDVIKVLEKILIEIK